MVKDEKQADSLEDEIVKTIFKFLSLLRGKKPIAGSGELTLAQMHCVLAVGDKSPTMAQIASELEVSMPTVTVSIDKLVKDGYIERKADPNDRRVVRVSLTSQGKKMGQKMKDQKAAIIKDALAKLSVSDRKKTQEVLNMLLQAVENKPI
ncbi:MAG: MarR family transcriptional regulator [Acidimicrobiia bacterium]